MWYQPINGEFPILSLITYLPAIGALLLMMLRDNRTIKLAANLILLADFFLSLPLYFHFESQKVGFQFVEKATWFTTANGSFEIGYHFGLDGISLMLLLLTTFLGPIACLSAWDAVQDRVKEFYIFLLLLQTGMMGVFCALDFVLFYVFWEVMLVPMYFLIGIWGGARRLYAAIKFFLYTLAGSVLMLLGILAIVFHHADLMAAGKLADMAQHAQYTFDIPTLTATLQAHPLASGPEWWYGIQGLVFLAFFLGFAIKVPMFPFHTWLPDAHVEAPTAGSVILAGVLLKMGTYGFVRFSLPMFPGAMHHFLPFMGLLCIIGIIYGALVAMKQDDVKKLVAYSSVSHLGFTMLGIFALNHNGILGGMLQMINHGLSTGMLFLCVGVIYERRHTRLIADFGGLSKPMTKYAIVFAIATMSSIGLPALNGFIGEFTVLLGVFLANKWWAVFAATGIVLGAAYMLWLYQRMMFGPITNPKNEHLADLNTRELVYFAPLVVMCFWIGLYPKPFIEPMEVTIQELVRLANPAASVDGRTSIEPTHQRAIEAFDAHRRASLAHGAGHGEHADDGHAPAASAPHDADTTHGAGH